MSGEVIGASHLSGRQRRRRRGPRVGGFAVLSDGERADARVSGLWDAGAPCRILYGPLSWLARACLKNRVCTPLLSDK